MNTNRTFSTVSDLRGNRTVYTWINSAAFNRDPSGDFGDFFASRADRNAALESFRAAMIERGLSVAASRSGIRPVKISARALRDLGHGCSEVMDAPEVSAR